MSTTTASRPVATAAPAGLALPVLVAGRVPLLYAAAIFVGAGLLFAVEPMFARMALPRLGGSPAVWLIALAFFQVVLLSGYVYAHALTRLVAPRGQAVVHIAVLLAAGAMLPVGVPSSWRPATDGGAVWATLELLAAGVGLPFFALASTSPLLQAWFSRSRPGSDPYVLYAASNLGSLLALVAYPLALEPAAGLSRQAGAWTLGYGVFVALVAGCVVGLWHAPSAVRAVVETALPLRPRRLAGWTALACLPSSAVVGATAYITGEIAPVPLLWLVPLGLYLSTFVLAFARRQVVPPRLAALLLALSAPVLLAVLLAGIRGVGVVAAIVALNLAVLWLASLVCHQALVAARPPPSQLTTFYLCLSLGGALGGVAAAIVAPLVFASNAEYPLTVGLVCLLLVRRLDLGRWPRYLAAVGGGIAVAGFVSGLRTGGLAFGLESRPVLHVERSFFGVHRVLAEHDLHLLVHGDTVHGAQATDDARARTPLSYYHPAGPVGDAFDHFLPPGGAAAVVGLGTGAVACYARPGQRWTFYEIDPAVERIARNGRYFTYLRDCAPDARIILGDGRLTLAASADRYDLLVLDAYSSDTPPLHLLTREALAVYLAHLGDGGVLAFHLSNRYLDLRPVVAALAADAHLAAIIRDDVAVPPVEVAAGRYPSRWALLARDGAVLAPLVADPRWTPLVPKPDFPIWSDDHSNLVSVLRWPGS